MAPVTHIRSRTHDIELEWPIEVGGSPVHKLTLRRPTSLDLRKLADGKGSDSERSMRLFVDLAQVEPAVIDALDPEDYAKFTAWLEPILDPKGQPSSAPGS